MPHTSRFTSGKESNASLHVQRGNGRSVRLSMWAWIHRVHPRQCAGAQPGKTWPEHDLVMTHSCPSRAIDYVKSHRCT